MKFKSVCFFVLLVVCAFAFGSGSQQVAPVLEFRSWKAGQGAANTESGTFITNTETTCTVTGTVGYAANQPANAATLLSFNWNVTMTHGFTFSTTTKTQSGNTGSTGTTFSWTSTGTGHQHSSTTRAHCTNYSEYNSNNAGHHGGRAIPNDDNDLQDAPMAVTIKFVGTYKNGCQQCSGSGCSACQVTITRTLTQDTIDQMRQEYLDNQRLQQTHRPNGTAITIPPRSDFSDSNSYNDGHYSKMIDKNLATKKQHWAQACDKYVGEDLKKSHRITSLHKTGGYRNSHHHLYHVLKGSFSSTTAFGSFHQYGRALDVRTVDMDGDKVLENTRATKWRDSEDMANAAKKYANAGYRKWNYSDGHVHAQWAGNSTSSERVTQTPEENDPSPMEQSTTTTTTTTSSTTTSSTTPSTTTTPPTPTYHACGVHETWQSGDHSAAGCGTSGHYVCDGSDHSLQARCAETDEYGTRCTVTSCYACDGHSHVYPQLYKACTRIVTKQRWDVVGRTKKGKRIYGWVDYQEACGETFYIFGTDTCEIVDNRAYRHSAD
ncbi:MAG: hypothetical protein OXI67_18845 [Candidatus Poribacteria bacterium]|nr:hypothetical protein [Candidatus Poribacteria bacterium]